MKFFRRSVFAVLLSLLIANSAWAANYKIDLDHSTVSFKIRHLLSNVTGSFNKFEGKIEYDPAAPQNSTVNATIDASTIDTNNEGRDKHLRTADFFDTERIPTITFKSTAVKDATEKSAKVEGVLSLHGVEKPVTLDVQIHGIAKDPWGNTRAGFTATTKINRTDFGIVWNKTMDAGQVLLGDEVEITLEIEAIQEA